MNRAMAALGRILQLIGWLWLVVGVLGRMFGFLELTVLPGIVLIFVARVMRNQAQQTEMPDLGDRTVVEDEPEPAPPERMMNTERRRQPPPEPAYVEPPAKDQPRPMKRNDLLEQIVGSGGQAEGGETSSDTEQLVSVDDPESRRPMSSAEMIARAHERWDSKPR